LHSSNVVYVVAQQKLEKFLSFLCPTDKKLPTDFLKFHLESVQEFIKKFKAKQFWAK